jgi:glycosyltransferase involved in cell wall biosynthesis
MSESFICVTDSKSKSARFSSKTLGALIMVKNEEVSIRQTIQSLKNVVSDVIVFDTGSTDKTIDIIKATCLKNNQTLHLKISTFKTFPESRNESIEFAETVDVENLIMLDAGDEFECDISISEWLSVIKTIPTGYNFGVVKLKWLESNNLTEHYDIRLIKNRKGCRYDLTFPVHEKFATIENSVHFMKNLTLHQNRDKYSESTSLRMAKDIELLSKAKPHSRNYYYLAQSYIFMKDYKNGFKYNLMVLDFEDQDYDKIMVYSRLMRCAIECKMSSKLIIKYFKLAIDEPNNPQMEPFINFFKYCMQENILELTLPYLKQLSELVKPSTRDFSHKDYEYTRWLLIYQICLMTRTNRDIGQIACNKAIQAQNNECDKMNLSLFQNIPNTIPNMITIDEKLETKPAANVETEASDLSAYLSSKGFNNLEGNVGGCPAEYLDLIELTKKPIVNVMEIGFNGGHSAELFLKNNDDIHLTSFDIGAHAYLLKGKAYIDARYPNRHTLILGDSKITVANFYKNNKDKKFDFIFIDGGHDYETAKADMENCFHLAHKDTIVALDDTIYRQDWTQFWNIGPTLTWMQHLEQNKITELNRVEYAPGQGMSWGKYIF